MGKAPSAPLPPDPRETAAAQTSTNIASAIAQQQMNNIGQVTPYGNLRYDQTGTYVYKDPLNDVSYEIPTYTAVQELNTDGKNIQHNNILTQWNLARLGAQQSDRLLNLLNRPVDITGAPEAGNVAGVGQSHLQAMQNAAPLSSNLGDTGEVTKTYGTDFSQDRQRVEDALMSRINPSLERDRASLEARLASQGISIGSEAYQAAMDDFGRQSNDARYGAILNAGQEQSRLTGLEAQRAGFENQAQQQQFGQSMAGLQLSNEVAQQNLNNLGNVYDKAVALETAKSGDRANYLQEQFNIRNQPLNEIISMLSGSQLKDPTFVNSNAAQLATTDYAGIQQNYDQIMQQRAMMEAQQSSGLLGGILGGIGGLFKGAMMLSDERTKTDIKKVGKTDDGQNIYTYRYKSGGPIQMGMMAQEVEKKRPSAVKSVGGIKMVDYGKATKGKK